MTNTVELRDIAFSYDDVLIALEIPLLEVGPGLTLVAGANGSGKSTMLRIMAGIERPSRGTVKVGGIDAWRDEVAARRLLAYVPDQPELTPFARISDALGLVAALRGAGTDAVDDALARVDLLGYGNRTIRELSMGQRRRAMLATALVGDPRIVLLDEPLETLDAATRAFVCAWVAALREQGACIILATHDVAPFASVTDAVLEVRGGRVHHLPMEGRGR